MENDTPETTYPGSEAAGTTEIVSDGRTVWVNSADGCCIARFSRFGIDVHHDYERQRLGSECIACTHETPDLAGWRSFQILVRRYHNVGVGDDRMPGFIREEFMCAGR